MEFANKYVLILLPFALVLAALLAAWAADRRRAALSALLGGREKWKGKIVASQFKRQLKWLLLMAAIVFAALAAARPWWGTVRVPGAGRGRDVVFVIDVSKSMLAEDVAPSRLAHAKFVANRIMEDNPNDRFAIVAFAGDAILSCPLTNDRGSLELFMKELTPDSIPVGGTNLQLALELVMRVFSGAAGNTRAVVMLTDGEELAGNAGTLLARLQSEHIPIYVMGVGSPSVPAMIPLRDERGQVSYLRDRLGNPVQTKLNPELLADIAKSTGGEYIPSTAVNSGVEEVDHYLKKLSTASYEEREKPRIIERFMPFLAAAALALLFSLLISERPSGKAAAVLVAVLALNPAFSVEKSNADGKADDTPISKSAEREPWMLYDEAREAQLANDLQSAETKYREAVGGVGKNQDAVRLYSYHNLGVIDHERARQSLKNARDTLSRQELDGALKQLGLAKDGLDKAEELYVNSMHYAVKTDASAPTAEAQQQLLLDREEVEELIRQIEELKKQQQQAQQSARQAREEMRRQENSGNGQDEQNQSQENSGNGQDEQNQSQENSGNGQDEQNQSQENSGNGQDEQGQSQENSGNGQDEQNQPRENSGNGQDEQNQPQESSGNWQDEQGQPQENSGNNDVRDAIDNAGNEAEKLADQAEKLGQHNLGDRAGRARDELEKASEAEKNGDRDRAREHVDNALDELSGGTGENGEDARKDKADSNGRDDGSQDPQEQSGGQSRDENDGEFQENPDAEADNAPDGGEEQNHQSLNELDGDMVDQLLDKLNRDERELRNRLNRRNRRPGTVEKDW